MHYCSKCDSIEFLDYPILSYETGNAMVYRQSKADIFLRSLSLSLSRLQRDKDTRVICRSLMKTQVNMSMPVITVIRQRFSS
jgi:hypothetical protein